MTTTTPARVLLKDMAYKHIKKLIINGTFPPGRFISERELSAELDMSKTPIRAALERLAEQGFVQIEPQRGVVVRDLSAREISDHYDFRMAIESWIMKRLAGHLTPERIRAVEANLALQHSQTDGEIDIQGFTAADADFHMLLAGYVGNAEFVRAMKRQREKLQRVVESIFVRDASVPPKSCAEHEEIFEALKRGDGDDAAELVVAHLEHGKKFLLMGGTYGE